jgi:hypothetical protein
MLQKARDHLVVNSKPDPQASGTQFSFIQGSAEDLHGVVPEDGSVDLLIAGKHCQTLDLESRLEGRSEYCFSQRRLVIGLTGTKCGLRRGGY